MLKKLILIILLICAPTIFAGQQNAGDSVYFLSLSDIHFDPFISCYGVKKKPCPLIQTLREARAEEWPAILAVNDKSVPTYRLDSNYALLKSSLKAASEAANSHHARFVLVLGDFIGHDFRKYYRKYAHDSSHQGYQAFLDKTLQFVAHEIAIAFPSTSVYPVVGNNDTYSRDYGVRPSGQFFHDTLQTWAPLIKDRSNRLAMQKTFPFAGYYAVSEPQNEKLKVIILNSVLFSHKVQGEGVANAAKTQLSWLHSQLADAKAKHEKVLIAMHIPVGVDVYATLRLRLFTLVEFWKPEYSKQFKTELAEFQAQIVGIFSGHLHSDWFQILTLDNGNEIAVSGTPAISPIFGNNPGFKIYQYSLKSRQINDYYTYYYPLEDNRGWGLEYEFNRVYQPNCHLCSLIDGMRKLRLSGDAANHYIKFYTVSKSTDLVPITSKWNPYFWCFTRDRGATDYQKCVS